MSRQEAMEQYARALRQGRRTYKSRVLQGRYPYPQVLDEILDETMTAGQADMGVVEIPSDRIVGTLSPGRRSAFAADFMPLLDVETEFASKWIELCTAHLGDEGIRDPVRCYEYLGRFYIQEGNKRVSVLKSYGAPIIPARVIRMLPVRSDEPETMAYYDFVRYYQLSGLYSLYFSRAGRFDRLQAALGYEAGHVWTEGERLRFASGFARFDGAFRKLSNGAEGATPADALLVWLRVYPFEALRTFTNAELSKTLNAVWTDVKASAAPDSVAVSTETQEPEKPAESGILGRIVQAVFPKRLNAAFVSDCLPEESDWARAHDLGRQYLETVMDQQVSVRHFDGVGTGAEAEEAMEEAIAEGAQVIFATTPPLIGACRKAAAQHPGVRVLNCAASMPYTGVRTYYSRIYEGKFITGAIAGALCRDGRIGYVASNPIFGVPASVNAFALGVQMTNPGARILLRWSCAEEDPMGALAREGVGLISNRDVPTPDRMREPWGLCLLRQDGSLHSVASPYWHWGNVYVKLARNILSGGWDAPGAGDGRAVNYWWGMRSGAVDILLDEELPAGVRFLAETLRSGVANGSVLPFGRSIRAQDGGVRNDGSRWFWPEEILKMDWLCDNVDGSIPAYDELLPMSRRIVRLQGIYRDAIPPEKEDAIL